MIIGIWLISLQPLQREVVALFRDKKCFRRNVTAPAPINGHHNGWGGNLRYVVEVAKHTGRIALDVPSVSTGLLILRSGSRNRSAPGIFG